MLSITAVFILHMVSTAHSDKFKIHIGTIESWSYAPFSLPFSGGAIDMAVEKITEKYKDTIEFNFTMRRAVGGFNEAGAVAAELYYVNKVNAFIGPASSGSVEAMAYMVAQWNIPFISPTGGAGTLADTSLFPSLTRISPLNVGSFIQFNQRLLDYYEWKHFVVIYDIGPHSKSQWTSLKTDLDKTTHYIWTYYEIDYNEMTDEDYDNLFTNANKYARVFIFLSQARGTIDLALAAHRNGFTKGEHVFVTTMQYIINVGDYLWMDDDEVDQILKQAYRSFLFLTLPSFQTASFGEFEAEVKERALRDYGFDHSRFNVTDFAASYYDSFMIFAQVANETLAKGENPLNGSAFARKLWNRTFTGIANRVVINEDGTRASDLDLQAIDPTTGAFRIVGRYRGDLDQYRPEDDVTIYWPSKSGAPLDIPLCGFRNDLCPSNEDNVMMTALLASLGVVILVSALLTVYFVRRWKRKSEEDEWWWRIDASDLGFTDCNRSGSGMLSVTSKISLVTNKDTPFLDYITDTAFYKGTLVRVRKIPMKQFVVTKTVIDEFKMMRELNHANLLRVVGAAVDNSPRYLVTEFCAKGTLQDLLGNSRLGLDTNFKFSLCIDIVQGMCYIHNSAIHKHGNLTSVNCLIDNRFSVKLTDFGLNSILHNLIVDEDSQEYQTDCLWRAPEYLRDPRLRGSQAGDVYSYGIVLMEIITREAPFYDETDVLDAKTILENVKKCTHPPFRPRVEVPESMAELKRLMQVCWSEDPAERPDFQTIKKTLKKLASKFGASGNLLDNLLRRMEQYANNLEKLVDEKTVELKEEKKKSEELLYQILPRSVAEKLRQGQRVDPEDFRCVTIYFSDICGFTTISARSTPFEVVDLLNDLYTCFDAIIDNFDVYKIETIGDAYMVVSGLPQRNGRRHVLEIARMSLALLKGVETFTIRHLPDEKLRLRIGLHSGAVVAGVVGLKMPRYCLFGDTVNTASRMESHGEELKIHISGDTNNLLSEFENIHTESRGLIEIKGKGQMETFWLVEERRVPKIELLTAPGYKTLTHVD